MVLRYERDRERERERELAGSSGRLMPPQVDHRQCPNVVLIFSGLSVYLFVVLWVFSSRCLSRSYFDTLGIAVANANANANPEI